MPLISVLMSVYKEPAPILIQAIDSILDQTLQDIEFIIVLDNPEGEQQKSVLENKQLEDGRIRLIINEENLGLAASLNKAANAAQGLYFCRMDADDISLPRRLSAQLEYLREQDMDLVGGFMNVINDNGDFLYRVDSIPTTSAQITHALAFNNCIPHPTWFGKRDVLLQKYRNIPFSEDYDFLLRAQLAGKKLGNCPHVLVNYRMTNESISRTHLYRQFLYQKLLADSYDKDAIVDIAAAEAWVEQKWNLKKAKRYDRANALFHRGYHLLTKGKTMDSLITLAQIPFTSLAYCTKIIRMLRAKNAQETPKSCSDKRVQCDLVGRTHEKQDEGARSPLP